MTQGQYDALVSFGFNTGEKNLEKLKSDINAGNWETVYNRMLTFNKARDANGDLHVLNGLTKRRQEEVNMARGHTPTEGEARVHPDRLEGEQKDREKEQAAAEKEQAKGETPAGRQAKRGLLQQIFGGEGGGGEGAPNQGPGQGPGPGLSGLFGGWNLLGGITGPRYYGENSWNPLGLTDEQRRNLAYAGLGMFAPGGVQGLQAASGAETAAQQRAFAPAELAIKAAQVPRFGAIHGIDPNTGQPYGWTYDIHTGAWGPPVEMGGRGGANDIIEQRAQRVKAGLEPVPPKGDPQGIGVMNRVRELDPEFNANKFQYRQQYEAPGGRLQKQMESFNTAVHHAEVIQDHATDAAKYGNTYGNALNNTIRRARGDDALKTFENSASLFGDEMAKASSSENAAHEREDSRKRVSSDLPAHTIKAGNAANLELMLGKLLSQQDEWKVATHGEPHPDTIGPQNRAIMKKVFAEEPNAATKAKRYERLSRDPRTADLVEGTGPAGAGGEPKVTLEEAKVVYKKALAAGRPDLAAKVVERAKAAGIKPEQLAQ